MRQTGLPEKTTGPAEAAITDPFAPAPEPNAYVPRDATREALDRLLRSVRDPDRATLLVGAPGMGKTLLVHLLARELRDEMRSVYLPVAAVSPAEMCDWVLRRLGSSPAEDPVAELLAYCRHLESENSVLLLLIDRGESLPHQTARRIRQWVADAGGSLRWCIVGTEATDWKPTRLAIGEAVDEIRLSDPMTEAETRDYIAGRLALARIPKATRARFTDRVVARLHRDSSGVPGRLQAACSAILHGAPGLDSVDDAVTPKPEPGSMRDVMLEFTAEEVLSELVTRTEPGVRSGPDGSIDEATARLDRLDEVPASAAPPASGDPVAAGDPVESGIRELRELALRPSEKPIRKPPRRRGVILAVGLIAVITLAIPMLLSGLRDDLPIVRSALPQRTEAVPALASTAQDVAVERPLSGKAVITAGPLGVNVNADPWAEIRVDGLDVGQTPIANIPLLAGPHVFRAQMPDGRVFEREVSIDADRRFIVFP